MAHLGILKLAGLSRWPYYTVTWLDRFHCVMYVCVYLCFYSPSLIYTLNDIALEHIAKLG